MSAIDAKDLERDPAACLREVRAGKTVLIVDDGRPFAEIKPCVDSARQRRPAGLCKEEFTVPDDFDAPLPDEIIQQFES